jgi:hypothetical protein
MPAKAGIQYPLHLHMKQVGDYWIARSSRAMTISGWGISQ